MRYFVFGREVIPKWFAEAINKEEIVYEYKENKVVGFKIIKSKEIGTFGSIVCKSLDDTIRILRQ